MNTVMGSHNESLFGIHLLVDAYNCNKEVLEDPKALRSLLVDITQEMDMKMICEPQVVEIGSVGYKDPGGCSGFVMISESHISFHTFPKRGFVTADVYTCRTETDTYKLIKLFSSIFESDDVVTQVIKRGTRYPINNIHN